MKKLLFMLIFLLNNVWSATIYIQNLTYEKSIKTIDFNTNIYNNEIKKRIILSNLFKIYENNYILDESKSFNKHKKNKISPDYILIGKITEYDKTNDLNQIIGTNLYSNTHNLSLLVSYDLIRTQDQKIILSFNSLGTGDYVKISNLEITQKENINMNKLIFSSAISLADNVLLNLKNNDIKGSDL